MAGFTWTPAQGAVLDEPADSRVLVIADAGTGKTAVVIERLRRLVDSGIAPGDEIILLSFTRVAVGEIRRRLREPGGAAAFARVATFDSFATHLLYTYADDEDWQEAGFDGRIRAAIQLLSNDESEALKEVRRYRHIFVDEIQDLVGVRADLVMALLARSEGGFTLLGDPAQAIYDWSDDTESGSDTVFERVRAVYDATLREYVLDRNHRATTELARTALAIGPRLREPQPDYEKIWADLLDLALGLPRLGGLDSLRANPAAGTTAILCRTNGQALVVSSGLHDRGRSHRLQRAATDRVIAPWLGRILSNVEVATLSRRSFDQLIRELPEDRLGTPSDAWRMLRRLGARQGEVVEIDRIRMRIKSGHVPDELTKQPEMELVVSTVHRAKGLEFDSVIVLVPGDLDEDVDSAIAAEVRTLYVAMTRPRKRIMTMPPGLMRGVYRDSRSYRWVRCGRETWQTFGFEVEGDDADKTHPPGSYLATDSPRDVQEYLWERVVEGDDVELRFLRGTTAGRIMGFYSIHHDGQLVGVTSEAFGLALARRLKRDRQPKGRWPRLIDGLHVDGIDTVAGSQAASKNAGLGGSGVWLRVRPTGLGRVSW